MTIELTGAVEEQLRELAVQQGRALESLVEEAVQEYLVAVGVTDVTPAEVAETQINMAPELPGFAEWKDGGE